MSNNEGGPFGCIVCKRWKKIIGSRENNKVYFYKTDPKLRPRGSLLQLEMLVKILASFSTRWLYNLHFLRALALCVLGANFNWAKTRQKYTMESNQQDAWQILVFDDEIYL